MYIIVYNNIEVPIVLVCPGVSDRLYATNNIHDSMIYHRYCLVLLHYCVNSSLTLLPFSKKQCRLMKML